MCKLVVVRKVITTAIIMGKIRNGCVEVGCTAQGCLTGVMRLACSANKTFQLQNHLRGA